MVRWKPGAGERLQAAAMRCYAENGFEQTTVAQIAQEAGVTERTFFRHFADKREVLFEGQDVLQRVFLEGVQTAPEGSTPLEMAAGALAGAAVFFDDKRRPWSRTRQVVIDANPGLRERELLKMAALRAALAAALRDRGVPEPAATLAAETAGTVFHVTFQQWIAEGETRPFEVIERDIFARLTALSAGADAPAH